MRNLRNQEETIGNQELVSSSLEWPKAARRFVHSSMDTVPVFLVS